MKEIKTQSGTALIEFCLLISLICMISFAALARFGYNTAAEFCRPMQAMADESTLITGITKKGQCKWEDGGMTKNYAIQRLF